MFAPIPFRNVGDVGNNDITMDMHIACSHQPVFVSMLLCVFFRFELAPEMIRSASQVGPMWANLGVRSEVGGRDDPPLRVHPIT